MQTKKMKQGRNPRTALICFVGIDGAGKSTLAKSVISIAEEGGVRCKYVWGGFTSSFMIFRPLVAVMKRSVFRGDKHMEESKTKGRVLKSSLLSTIYQNLVLIEYIFQASFRIRLPLTSGRNVICDRYVYDLIAAISVLLDYPADRTMALLGRCLAFLPEPDLVFLIDLPEMLAYQRKDDIVSLDFLSVRRDIYLRMAQRHGMIILDGSSDPGELANLAASEVMQYITGER